MPVRMSARLLAGAFLRATALQRFDSKFWHFCDLHVGRNAGGFEFASSLPSRRRRSSKRSCTCPGGSAGKGSAGCPTRGLASEASSAGKRKGEADEQARPHRSPGRRRSGRALLHCTCGRRFERREPSGAKHPRALPRLVPRRAAGASPAASRNVDAVGVLPGRRGPGLPPRRADPHLDLRPGLAAALLPCQREGEPARACFQQGCLLVPGCRGRTLPALPRRRALAANRLRLALCRPASEGAGRAALRLMGSAQARSARGAARPPAPAAAPPRPR